MKVVEGDKSLALYSILAQFSTRVETHTASKLHYAIRHLKARGNLGRVSTRGTGPVGL